VQHVCQVTLSTSLHTSTVCIRYQILLAAYYKADTKYCCCRATCLLGRVVDFTTHINRLYTIPSIVGGILQSRYQVLLLSCNMFVRSRCRLHYTHINRLYTISSIVGGILQSRYQVLLLSCNMFVKSHCRLHYTHINRLYTIQSKVGGILQSRYQVLLLSCNMFVRSHCRLHYTHINRLYTIPSKVGGILQSVLNLIQCVNVLRYLINNL
jgi:5-keto 4-deoxyuronate isomerase